MSEDPEGANNYRLKATHMRKLAEQSQHGLARSAYLALAASWLKLAERSGEFGRLAGEEQDHGPA